MQNAACTVRPHLQSILSIDTTGVCACHQEEVSITNRLSGSIHLQGAQHSTTQQSKAQSRTMC